MTFLGRLEEARANVVLHLGLHVALHGAAHLFRGGRSQVRDGQAAQGEQIPVALEERLEPGIVSGAVPDGCRAASSNSKVRGSSTW